MCQAHRPGSGNGFGETNQVQMWHDEWGAHAIELTHACSRKGAKRLFNHESVDPARVACPYLMSPQLSDWQ